MSQMKQHEQTDLFYAVWREKGGWAYKIEKRGANRALWSCGGYENHDTAEMAMRERLKGIEGMK